MLKMSGMVRWAVVFELENCILINRQNTIYYRFIGLDFPLIMFPFQGC